jgi:hypothetical protein
MRTIQVKTAGPFINAAFFCEKVIEDKEGVLSAIRIVDRVINTAVGLDTPTAMPPMPVALTLVITLKSGAAKGRLDVRIAVERPSGLQSDLASALSVVLEGDDRGANLVMNLALTMTEEGLYWFDVYVEETLATRVPLRIVYQRQQAGGPRLGPSGSGESEPPNL